MVGNHLTRRRAHTWAVAVVVAALVAVLLVAGPPQQRAHAAHTASVATLAALQGAVAAINGDCDGGTHTIEITADIVFGTDDAQLTYTCGDDLVIVGVGEDRSVTRSAGSGRFLESATAAHVTIENLIVGDFSSGSSGGAMDVAGAVTVTDSVFRDNTASNAGGLFGGAIRAGGSVTATRSVFAGNTATSTGGGSNGGAISSGASVTVIESIFEGNHARNAGGAIVPHGGNPATFVRVIDSVFIDNTVDVSSGGAISATSSAVEVSGSTFSGNRAADGLNAGAGSGGAISSNGGSITVDNSTFTGNISVNGGGAISTNIGPVTLTHVTMEGNDGPGAAHVYMIGGFAGTGVGGVTSFGSVFADPLNGGNPGVNCHAGLPDVTRVSAGYNWADDDTCWTNIDPTSVNAGIDPGLGALQDNGGLMPTLFPDPALSPLVDAIPAEFCDADTEADQRGAVRPSGPGCDIGAVEVGQSLTVAKTADVDTVDQVGDVITYEVTVANQGEVAVTGIELVEELVGAEFTVEDCGEIGTLDPGDDAVCEVSYEVTQEDLDQGEVVNEAGVTGTATGTGSALSASASVTVEALQSPSIGVGIATDQPFVPAGEDLLFEVEVSNTGNVTLEDVELVDLLPGTVFTAAGCGDVGTLAPGDDAVCEVAYQVTTADAAAGSVTGTVRATGIAPGGGTVQHTAQATVTLVRFVLDVGGAQQVTVSVYGAVELQGGATWAPAAEASVPPPAGLILPFGIIGFTVTVPQPGDSVLVVLDLPSPVTSYWKLQDGAWFELEDALITAGAAPSVNFTLTDGGIGDADEDVDGVIVDPGAPAVSAAFTG